MNSIFLSLLSLLKASPGTGVSYDAAPPIPLIAIGLLVILVIAAIIVGIIIFAIKGLKRIRKKSDHTPQ